MSLIDAIGGRFVMLEGPATRESAAIANEGTRRFLEALRRSSIERKGGPRDPNAMGPVVLSNCTCPKGSHG